MNIKHVVCNFLRKARPYLITIGFCLIFIIFFGTADVVGNSMLPTCNDGDKLIISKFGSVKYGDIVAIYSDSMNEMLCKRVIGVSGDTILLSCDGLFVNGEYVTEDYVNDSRWYETIQDSITFNVGENEVFVLGDNRNISLDSRRLGCLKTDNIYGVSLLNFTRITHISSGNYAYLIIALWCIFFLAMTVDYVKKRSHRSDEQ